jgi:hypothetical protein
MQSLHNKVNGGALIALGSLSLPLVSRVLGLGLVELEQGPDDRKAVGRGEDGGELVAMEQATGVSCSAPMSNRVSRWASPSNAAATVVSAARRPGRERGVGLPSPEGIESRAYVRSTGAAPCYSRVTTASAACLVAT